MPARRVVCMHIPTALKTSYRRWYTIIAAFCTRPAFQHTGTKTVRDSVLQLCTGMCTALCNALRMCQWLCYGQRSSSLTHTLVAPMHVSVECISQYLPCHRLHIELLCISMRYCVRAPVTLNRCTVCIHGWTAVCLCRPSVNGCDSFVSTS